MVWLVDSIGRWLHQCQLILPKPKQLAAAFLVSIYENSTSFLKWYVLYILTRNAAASC
ncbi:hypothetical protein GGI1_11933, partial [Acidithiobacillus sp. GGI-221]